MCGRYYSRREKQQIADRFRAKKVTPEPLAPNFNIAPSTFQPVIRQERDGAGPDDRELLLLRWGLIPFFVKDLASFKSFTTINARAETVATAPTFRAPFKSRRCLIPCDGFYEWKTMRDPEAPMTAEELFLGATAEEINPSLTLGPKGRARKPPAKPIKVPFAFSLLGGDMVAFAGLWDAWKDPNVQGADTWLQSFTIVTTEANELMASVHTRMPVILAERDWTRWLDRDFGTAPGDAEQLQAMLRPFDSERMQAAACNPAVGNVRNNGPEMLVCPNPDEPLPILNSA